MEIVLFYGVFLVLALVVAATTSGHALMPGDGRSSPRAGSATSRDFGAGSRRAACGVDL